MKKIIRMGPLFIIVAALMWSFDGVLRRSLYALPPAVVVFYEHLLGALILLFLAKHWFADLRKLTRKEWAAVGIVALFSGALGTIFYTSALGKVNYIQFSVVVLLQQLQPIWAITAAAIVLKEKVDRKFLLWAALGLGAAFMITFKDLQVNFATGGGTITAALLAIGAGFMWGSSTAFSKYFLNKVSFITGTGLRFFITPVFAVIIIMAGGQTSSLFTLTQPQWISLAVITLSTGMVALLIYYYGLKRTPARVSTLCELVWPASAIFIDYFYYHNSLSFTQIAGVILLLLVIYKVSQLKK